MPYVTEPEYSNLVYTAALAEKINEEIIESIIESINFILENSNEISARDRTNLQSIVKRNQKPTATV